MSGSNYALTSRWILPVAGEPIQGGWIRVQDGRITEVSSSCPPSDANDLGDVAILPGLVNAHTHLEFSNLSKPVGMPGILLHDWIAMVIQTRGKVDPEQKSDAIMSGLLESLEGGVCLVGDIATPPTVYRKQGETPEVVSFAEVIGLSGRRSDERFSASVEHQQNDVSAAWSPHAPYSTRPDAVNRCVRAAAKVGRPLAMHVAESSAERELLTLGSGALAETLKSMGVWQDGIFPCSPNPFERLFDQLSIAPSVLVVHGNDLRPSELACLSKYAHATVVHCPRTHAFFGYPPHPVADCLAAGIPVALGTDSRASNPDLNLWSEVQYLLMHRSDLNPADVLRMATIAGADALMVNDVGRIKAGCRARLGMIRTTASTIDGVYSDFASETYRPLFARKCTEPNEVPSAVIEWLRESP